MSGYLYDALYHLPSVAGFIDHVVSDIANRRNVIVLLPSGVDPDRVKSRLREILWQREFYIGEIHLEELDPEFNQSKINPVLLLSDTFRIRWPDNHEARTLTNLFKCADFPEVIFFSGLHKMNEEVQHEWFEFIRYWAVQCQRIRSSGEDPPVLCIILEGESSLPFIPNSDVNLAVHWWWGFPSILEIQLLCRLLTDSDTWNSATMWREYIIPSITGSDISLIEYLWDHWEVTLDELFQMLICFSQERGWNNDLIRSCDTLILPTYSEKILNGHKSPPKRMQKSWANGLVSYSVEQGIEIHTAALAVLGDRNSIQHRIWRAQSKIVLPLLDSYRLAICELFTNYCGPDWPTRWDQPNNDEDLAAVRESPYAVSWGYIEHLLDHIHQPARFQYLLPLVTLGRSLRNKIAHYQPISFTDFNCLLSEATLLDQE